MNRTRGGALFVGLVAWVGLACAASCSPSDEARQGERVQHPVVLGPTAAPPPPTSLTPTPAPAPVTSAPAVERPLLPSEIYEQRSGRTLSPIDKAIIDDCPERDWSKNVPKRRCTKDGQCGDGFCDRGRCAAIRSCRMDYGWSCETQDDCSVRPCIDGRCRSCASEAECDWRRGRIGESEVKCRGDSYVPGARECLGWIGSLLPGGIK